MSAFARRGGLIPQNPFIISKDGPVDRPQRTLPMGKDGLACAVSCCLFGDTVIIDRIVVKKRHIKNYVSSLTAIECHT